MSLHKVKNFIFSVDVARCIAVINIRLWSYSCYFYFETLLLRSVSVFLNSTAASEIKMMSFASALRFHIVCSFSFQMSILKMFSRYVVNSNGDILSPALSFSLM